ncbi:hypothetical protein [Jiangella alkaliphila]|uniref:Uncharacterized protein n=1 Tax=Jiangella alkaliphila TaxID=419479 RepID=A0A1H2L8F8_9ACTN|nr:hypothetical protein [Jiangella alkaliphila]SDU77082.1 hypothetical protein SAMN04488563_5413 [Jiangella alkaliphila]
MRLRFIAIDTGKDGCPTLYATDRDSYVIQGWRVADPTAVAGLQLGANETCIEVPSRLLTALEVPKGPASTEVPYVTTPAGTYVIRGPEILDAETLAQMNVPGHETAVEVPRDRLATLARELA